ncbi:MAG: hypothetical protein QOG30_813, partial [Acidimicrobiaceae bacterium]
MHVQLAPDTAVDLDLQLDPDGVAADIVFLPREDGEWVRAQRERLAVARRRALLARAASLIERGDPMAALVHLDTIVAANPFDEEAVREAMRANVASGRRAAALDVYDSLRRRLDDELGVRPTPLTEAAMLEALGEPPIAAPGTVALPVDAGSTFVGRSNHLDRLDAIAADAARGRLRMVLIEGESGVGKTRLLAEWSSRRPLAQVFWGRCTGAGVAFEPVVEALSRHFRAEPAALAELGPLGEPLSTLFPELLEPPPAPASLDPQQRRALLFRSITSAIAGPARDGGALWVVDDVQSADADTRDLLVHLAHGLSDEPVVLAMTLREPDAAVAGLLAELARRGFERMQLSGLSDLEVHSLLREAGMAGEEPDEITASVRSLTGGNPLYVRQLVE